MLAPTTSSVRVASLVPPLHSLGFRDPPAPSRVLGATLGAPLTHVWLQRRGLVGVNPASGRLAPMTRATAAKPELRMVPGIAEIALSGKYDAWILDQFGVLHDGKKAYPEAIYTLEKLAQVDGVKLVLLSNSSRRSQVTRDKLPSLGFDPSLFHAIITSGELTHRSLLQRDDAWFQSLGRKCIHFTWTSRGGVSLEGLGLEVVDSVDQADFLLAHGTEGLATANGEVHQKSMAELESILHAAAEHSKTTGRQLPLVIANPDFVTVEERALRVMPGTLGKIYASLGGEVKCMGKPDPMVFYECSSVTGVPKDRLIMVGDSLHHDILGASTSGVASIFICGGVHADELKISSLGSTPESSALEALCEQEDVWPTFVAPFFRW